MCTDTGVRIGDTKGAALHLRGISHAFAALGHQVEVVGVAASAQHAWSRLDVPANVVPHLGRAIGAERERRKMATVASVRKLAHRVARRLEPDAIYERLSLFGDAGVEVARRAGCRHVVEVNALLADEEAAWRNLLLVEDAQRIEASVLAAADLRIVVSEELAATVRRYAPGGPTAVVPNGADTDLFSNPPDRTQARHSLSLPLSAPLLVFTGTLRPWHGLDIAISALAELTEDVQLVVAGDGELQAKLVRHAQRLGVDHRIHWLGKIAHDRIPVLLAAGDIALAPYPGLPRFAFSPLKLYEYRVAGIPVIASDVGQIAHVLDHGRSGRLVTPGDPHALASAIRAELSDPSGGQQIARKVRASALIEHSWTNRAAAILEELSRVPVPKRFRPWSPDALAL
jgi:glycosyltransferase involved in cell wall biosynthesis